MTLAKLSAFIPVSKDMLDLGPAWLDNYVRIILSEASAGGLEKGIVKGTGKDEPVGMCKDLEAAVTKGVYSDKSKTVLKTLSATDYCAAVAPLAKKPDGGYRVVPEVMLIVNPVDYISKVIPASTVRDSSGNYKNNVFPYPTNAIQSQHLQKVRRFLEFLINTLWVLVPETAVRLNILTNISSYRITEYISQNYMQWVCRRTTMLLFILTSAN